MASDVVQFREDEAAIGYLRGLGVNPNEFARRAFDAALRGLRAEDKVKRLATVRARLPKPVADLVREARDAR